jgi:hypothetical protein
MTDADRIKQITTILCLWVQERYTDREAMEMIYDVVVEEN